MAQWRLWGNVEAHELICLLDELTFEQKQVYHWLGLRDIMREMQSRKHPQEQGYWSKLCARLEAQGFIKSERWGRENKRAITARGHESAKLWKLIKVRMEQIK